jgi:uncharacterized membrane protein YbhN (UPF0104 family)
MPETTAPPAVPPLPERHAALAVGLALALLAAVAWGVHRFAGWHTVLATAGDIPRGTWIAAAAWLALSYAARVLRLWRLLHDIEPRVRPARVAATFFVHNGLATFLPARLGEAGMPLLARRWLGMDWAATVGVLGWWRVFDLAIVAALVLALLAAGARVLAPLYAFALAACALPVVVFAGRAAVARRLARSNARLAGLASRVLAGMPRRRRAFAADLALALTGWSTKLVAFTILLHGGLLAQPGVPHDLPLPLVAAAALAADVAGALPLPTLGGVGPFEAGIVLGLGALGVATASAVALAVTLHGAVLASIAAAALLAFVAGTALRPSRAA